MVSPQVFDCLSQSVKIIVKVADPEIAFVTQQTTKPICLVAMIEAQRIMTHALAFAWASANGTHATLHCENPFVLVLSEAVLLKRHDK